MTTERLTILAAAAALGEFTAQELAAYTGANPSTVRQVLKREQERRQLFQKTKRRPPRGGRPAQVWRLTSADAIFEEIAEEEAGVADLQGAAGHQGPYAVPLSDENRMDAYLTSAEEAVTRCYETDDKPEQRVFAGIALNLLQAADPRQDAEDESNLGSNWWDSDPKLASPRKVTPLTLLESVSRARMGSTLPSFQESIAAARESNFDFASRRAQRIAAFASLAIRRAEDLPVGLEDLARAAVAISEGSHVLPVHQTLLWVKVFVRVSIESVKTPPVAVLTSSKRPPTDLFPVERSDWRQLKVPNELADTGYVLWVERWAESLLTSNLIPGVVVSYDDSPASNAALSQVMTTSRGRFRGRAVVIASTVRDFEVHARLTASGGTVYPVLQNTVEGLLTTVSRVVAEAVDSLPPDLAISQLASEVSRYMPEAYIGSLSHQLFSAIEPIDVRPSDIEITHKTLAALDSAIAAYRNLASGPRIKHSDLVGVFDRLSNQWPDPGQSQQAVATVHAFASQCMHIAELKTYLLRTSSISNIKRTLASWAIGADPHETHAAINWVHEEIRGGLGAEPLASDLESLLTGRELQIVDLLASGKTARYIAESLGASIQSTNKKIGSIFTKLGLEFPGHPAESLADIERRLRRNEIERQRLSLIRCSPVLSQSGKILLASQPPTGRH